MYTELGGLHNKAAQDVATRGNMLPTPIVDGLKHVFEDMPGVPWEEVEKILTRSISKSDNRDARDRRESIEMTTISTDRSAPLDAVVVAVVDSIFSEIDPLPIAAASIGQVHRATLTDGRHVVIKVIYPNIRRHMEGDLQDLRFLGNFINEQLDLGMEEMVG